MLRGRYGPIAAGLALLLLLVVAGVTGNLPGISSGTAHQSARTAASAQDPCKLLTADEIKATGGGWAGARVTSDESGSCTWTVVSANGGHTLIVATIDGRATPMSELQREFARSSRVNGTYTSAVATADSESLKPATGIAQAFYYGSSASAFAGTVAEDDRGSIVQIDAPLAALSQAALDALALDALKRADPK